MQIHFVIDNQKHKLADVLNNRRGTMRKAPQPFVRVLRSPRLVEGELATDNLILNSLDIHEFESREHLLEVLPLLEEATQRLGSPTATNTWLLTPVSPGGKKPIDLLFARKNCRFASKMG